MTVKTLMIICLLCAIQSFAEQTIEVPVLDSDWWQIAEREPDVGEYNNPGKHNACDFTIWQAEDGTWQLVSCIRNTRYPGNTRLFYRWEGKNLTDTRWEPKGIFATSNPDLGQVDGVMQAPHCFKYDGKYYFFYNSAFKNERGERQGNAAYCKISDDGKNFTDRTDNQGNHAFFEMGRDLMLYHENNTWHAYFEYRGKMSMRTAPKLEGPWSSSVTAIGNNGNPESPFMIKKGDTYYLWEQMKVFVSDNPTDFSDAPITKMTPGPVHGKYAPEILLVDGQYYIAAYEPGIWLCKIKWVEKTTDEINEWRRSFGIAE
jgi:hypothetical protein